MTTSQLKKGKGQLFSNTSLEVLSKAPPIVSAIFYFGIIILLLIVSFNRKEPEHWFISMVLFLLSLVFWTLFEYMAHRYLFHLNEYFPGSKLACLLAYVFHGIHHEYPRDTNRLIMPPVPGFLIIAILFMVSHFIMGEHNYLFLAGFLSGYLLYTYVHFKSHITPVPAFLKSQCRHHALHHFQYPDKAFGVSSPFWDWVFGTLPPKPRDS